MGSSLILAAHFPPSVTFGAFSRFLDSSFPFFGGVDTDGDNSNNKKKAREKHNKTSEAVRRRSLGRYFFGLSFFFFILILRFSHSWWQCFTVGPLDGHDAGPRRICCFIFLLSLTVMLPLFITHVKAQ